uniref:SWIM-type domain-containing protein n=1 Tax=Oryza brachyantha TaxID=4533 RepID=J3KVC7_ORYBR
MKTDELNEPFNKLLKIMMTRTPVISPREPLIQFDNTNPANQIDRTKPRQNQVNQNYANRSNRRTHMDLIESYYYFKGLNSEVASEIWDLAADPEQSRVEVQLVDYETSSDSSLSTLGSEKLDSCTSGPICLEYGSIAEATTPNGADPQKLDSVTIGPLCLENQAISEANPPTGTTYEMPLCLEYEAISEANPPTGTSYEMPLCLEYEAILEANPPTGFREEDDRAANYGHAPSSSNVDASGLGVDEGTEGASILVADSVPGELVISYDKNNPCMDRGTKYPSMKEFRLAVTVHNEEHNCTSSMRIRTTTPSQGWVADRALDILKTSPTMGAKELLTRLQDEHNVTLAYNTVWCGLEKAKKELYGSWEESFYMLYSWKEEVLKRSPGSVIEIDIKVVDGRAYFHRFFCAFSPCIKGFLAGCRPHLSVDSTHLNGRWNGHLAAATLIDGHNWMYPVAFGFIDSKTEDNWVWFMSQLHKAIGDLEPLAICSDACKGLENTVHKVFPEAEQRECFWHFLKNFSKKFHGNTFANMYPAARAYREAAKREGNGSRDKRRSIGERLQGRVLPAVILQLKARTGGLGHLKVITASLHTAEVQDFGKDFGRHVVTITTKTCTCEEWQHTGQPCDHALAFLTTQRNVNLADYVDMFYSVEKFKAAYEREIPAMPDKSYWPKRSVGRQRKLRIKGCLEIGGSTRSKSDAKNKKVIRGPVTCKRCGEKGHRQASYKCSLNGTTKRKRKTKKAKAKNQAEPSTPKKTTNVDRILQESPGMVTRRRLAMLLGGGTINSGAAGAGYTTNQSREASTSGGSSQPIKKKKVQD